MYDEGNCITECKFTISSIGKCSRISIHNSRGRYVIVVLLSECDFVHPPSMIEDEERFMIHNYFAFVLTVNVVNRMSVVCINLLVLWFIVMNGTPPPNDLQCDTSERMYLCDTVFRLRVLCHIQYPINITVQNVSQSRTRKSRYKKKKDKKISCRFFLPLFFFNGMCVSWCVELGFWLKCLTS